MSERLEFTGLLSTHSYGEADDILFLSSLGDPFAEELEDKIHGKKVSVRYWIADCECTKEEAQKAAFKHLFGVVSADFCARYSEITGYLWTDEGCVIGGHDLIDELKSHIGKWLFLEVDIEGDRCINSKTPQS
jgi:hypothetical protein